MKALVAVLALATSVAAGSAIHLYLTRPAPAPLQPVATVQQPAPTSAIPAVQPQQARPQNSELMGRLAAATDFEVRAMADGYVLHVRVDSGDFVERGQTLVELENPTLSENLRHAETTFELAKSELEAQEQRRAGVDRRQGMHSRQWGLASASGSPSASLISMSSYSKSSSATSWSWS